MEWFKKAWRGQERLWIVYWLYGVLGNIVLQFAGRLLIHAFQSFILTGILVAIYIVYLIWILVAQWRCAFNADWTFFSYLVRILVVLTPILFIVGLLLGGVLVGQDLVHAAQCRVEIRKAAEAAGIPEPEYRQKHPELIQACRAKVVAGAHSSTAPAAAPLNIDMTTPEAKACRDTMEATAKASNADPETYISANGAYLQQCIDYYHNNPSALKP